MTKKDYIKIAGAINVVACNYQGEKIPQEVLVMLAHVLEGVFQQNNNKFDCQRFFEACFKK